MKACLVLVVIYVCCVQATNFLVGDVSVGDLDHEEVVSYNAIIFKKRVKEYFYAQKDNRNIVGIEAIDNLYSKSSITITAGGVGHPFVKLRLKSERGRGLDYSVRIYVEPVQ